MYIVHVDVYGTGHNDFKRANPLQGPLKGVDSEDRDFLGPEMATSKARAIWAKKPRFSGPTPFNGSCNGFAPIKGRRSGIKWKCQLVITRGGKISKKGRRKIIYLAKAVHSIKNFLTNMLMFFVLVSLTPTTHKESLITCQNL
jgi:hypothetical protein